jgi:Ca2+-binding RTX toxin-like protein
MAIYTGTANDDTLIGGSGNNIIDTLIGGDGNDALLARRLENIADGTPRDFISWSNFIFPPPGSPGYNSFFALDGGNGNDFFGVAVGVDNLTTLDGGNGTDVILGALFPNADTPINLDLDNLPADLSSSGSTFNNISNVETIFSAVTRNSDDVISISRSFDGLLAGIPRQISLRDGNDQLTISGNATATVTGDEGNDTLTGGDGNDILHGDWDDDNRDIFLTGNDFVDGGGGDDLVAGGPGIDRLYGGGGIDTIYGGSGDDFAYSGDGNDSIFGGSGIDNLEGNEGNDTIRGEDGDDGLAGQEGNDWLFGDVGNDRLYGWTGNDVLYGGAGNDTIQGDDGDDLAFSGEGDDRILGGLGIDNLEGNEGNDTIQGEDGDDGLAGQEGDDLLLGGNGNDRLYGWTGNDFLRGDEGSNRFQGDTGNDTLIGSPYEGGGVNTFSFDALPGIQFTDLGIDTIAAFRPNYDKINLDRAIFTALPTALTNDSFQVVATPDQAATSTGLIVLSQGRLFYNDNGTAAGYGTGGAFAIFGNESTLVSANDFVISGIANNQ